MDIHDLIARYQWFLDMGDTERFLSLFTDDGVVDFENAGRFEGLSGIRECFERLLEIPTSKGRQHHVDSIWIEGGAAACVVRSYMSCTLFVEAGGMSVFLASGYYEDQVVRVDSEWKFKERKFRVWNGDVVKQFPSFVPCPAKAGIIEERH